MAGNQIKGDTEVMCATYIIDGKEVNSVLELTEFVTLDKIKSCCEDGSTPSSCLCGINPLELSLLLNSTVLCNLYDSEYIFNKIEWL